jgi:hypothetical protein
VDVISKMCEGCQVKYPRFGLPAEGKVRWCSGCAKGHAGVVNVKGKKCEGCQVKYPRFGLPDGGKKRRWCGDCAPQAARAGGRRTQAGGTAQEEPKATDPPVAIPPDL